MLVMLCCICIAMLKGKGGGMHLGIGKKMGEHATISYSFFQATVNK